MDYRLKDGVMVSLREFKAEDFDDMLAMFQSLNEKALQYGLPPYDRPRLERWVLGLGGGVLLLAWCRSKVVGVAMIFGRVHPRFKGVGEFVIYLHQDYHNQGLGTFLTKTILEQARGRQFHRVGLEVVSDNTGAVRAYEKAGFVVEGRLRDAFYGDDERYHDQLVMGIVL